MIAMKQLVRVVFMVAAFYSSLILPAAPLGTAFNYNGRLIDGSGPANGRYDLRFVLYDASVGGSQAGSIVTNTSVVVSNGLFSTAVDFGGGIWEGTPYWIELGVRTNSNPDDFTTLSPRQRVAPTPYAIFASEAGEAASLITGTYSNVVTFNNASSTFFGAFTGNGSGLTTLNASRLTAGTVPEARLSANIARLNSNQTYSGAVILSNTANIISGTFTGNASGLTGLSAANISSGTVPDGRLSANVARLSSNQTFTGANTFNPATGAPFAVGNATRVPNLNADLLDGLNSSAFSSSSHHHDSAYWKLGGNTGLGAGQFLGTTDNQPLEFRVNGAAAIRIEPTVGSPNVIEGVDSSGAGAVGATISGGSGHRINIGTTNASVGGGESNVVVVSSFGTITGGRLNLISNGWSAVIGGGESNSIRGISPSFFPINSVIGGGNNNIVESRGGTIGGGGFNEIGDIAVRSTISGGYSNRIMSFAGGATIGGGMVNVIHSSSSASSPGSTIAGGSMNVISNTDYSTIAGGAANVISESARYSFIAGGVQNEIDSRASFSSIGGGSYNAIGSWSSNATISGGISNSIGSNSLSAVISGGHHNRIKWFSEFATIAGGTHNTIHGLIWDTIGGGFRNTMTNTEGSTIAGGIGNAIQWPAGAFGAPLRGNAIGGGEGNIIQGVRWSTIPGGEENYIGASHSFAAGRRARAVTQGTFIWADATDADFVSTDNNEFAIRAAGGVRIQSDRGIRLNAADRPLITRGWDTFASGN
jgi:hypothetical protein